MDYKKLADGIDLYEGIFTEFECNHIIGQAMPFLSDSLVAGSKEGFISTGRISSNCWLPHNKTSTIARMCEKISYITCSPLENAEKLQVIHYPEGGLYNPHYDGWDHDNSEKQQRNMKYGGQRLLTALVYLNDVKEGGGTNFPKKNIVVKPKIGTILVFNNCIGNTNQKDMNSLHGGMPVIKGEKWAFNLWFREAPTSKIMYQNIFTMKIDEPVESPVNNIEPLHVEKPLHLEEGDYVPFFTWKTNTNKEKHLHNYVDSKNIIIIVASHIDVINNYPIVKLLEISYNIVYLIYNETNNVVIEQYFEKPLDNNIIVYALNCERRILNITHCKNNISDDITFNNYDVSHVPYIEIPNVLDKELLAEVISYYNNHEDKATLHNSSGKNRFHVHPDAALEKKLDFKLRKTAYFKMKEVFNFEVMYRELYKICCYDSESNGRFHAHRDSIAPHVHRMYGMSLVLNDDYEGGHLEFPEYNIKLKPKANTVIIFPGSYSHKVQPITKGKRMALISFLCKEIEGKTKNNPTYMLKD